MTDDSSRLKSDYARGLVHMICPLSSIYIHIHIHVHIQPHHTYIYTYIHIHIYLYVHLCGRERGSTSWLQRARGACGAEVIVPGDVEQNPVWGRGRGGRGLAIVVHGEDDLNNCAIQRHRAGWDGEPHVGRPCDGDRLDLGVRVVRDEGGGGRRRIEGRVAGPRIFDVGQGVAAARRALECQLQEASPRDQLDIWEEEKEGARGRRARVENRSERVG